MEEVKDSVNLEKLAEVAGRAGVGDRPSTLVFLHKDVLSVLLFSVLLPFLDVLSDVRAGGDLVSNGHPAWGAAVIAFAFVPCALRLAATIGVAILPVKCW